MVKFLGVFSTAIFWLAPALIFTQEKNPVIFKLPSPQINTEILGSRENLDAEIVLTKVPRGMFLDGDTKDISDLEWTPNVPCILRYATRPGNRVVENYPNRFQAEGAGKIALNPAQEGIRTGFYYCILVSKNDPAATSVEFTIIVQANASPIAKAPLGSINLQQGTPIFQWDRVSGVPYYFLFLSEGPIAIERNEEGEITGVTGLNLTWQVITTANFVKYGDPDPSGNFVNAHVPPLLTGIRYNWIVLNAYGPSTDMVSGEVAPLAPAFFEVSRPTLSQSPTLLEPAADALISADEIIFRWSPVADATRYRLFLYLTGDLSGSEVDFTFWSQVATGTEIRLPTRNLLVRAGYHWRVVAENANGVSASERRPFEYAGAAGWVKFIVDSDEGPVSRVSFDIKTAAETEVPVPTLTDTLGFAKLPLPAGAYSFRALRPGFITTARSTFNVPNNDTVFVNVEIARAATGVSAQIIDNTGNALFDAVIEFKAGDLVESTRSNSAGYVSAARNPGNWSYRVYKDRFVATPFESFTLSADENKNLGQITLQPATNRVNGQVTFAADGRPLQGALVRAEQNGLVFETTTGNTGGFTYTLGPGAWRISLNAQGFVASPPNYVFDFTENGQVAAPFQLAEGGIVYGRVLFQNHGLPDATIRALRKDSGAVAQNALSNALGDYAIGLPAGEYDLIATRPGFLEGRKRIVMAAGQTLVEDFTLAEAGFVEGRVINLETASPVANAKVFVLEDTTNHVFTDASGNYLLSLPPNTPLQIDAFLSGFDSNGPFTVSAASGETVRQDFFLKALSGVIRGQVTDGFSPVAGALVEILELNAQAVTNNQGRFEFTIPPGEYTLSVRKDCHFSKIEAVNLVAGVTEELDIVLEALQSVVTGRVTDSGGRAIPGAQVSAAGDTVFTTFTNASGNYQLCLNEGIFRITASQLGFLSASRTLVISEGDSLSGVNFTLQDNFARVTGVVVDTLNQPMAQAVVTLTNPNQTLVDTTTESGEYALERIIPGVSEIIAAQAGFYGIRVNRFLGGQQHVGLNLTLYPADGFISGAARDSQTHEGIPGGTVSAELSIPQSGSVSENPEEFFSTTTGADGRYTISNVPVIPRHTFTIFAFKEGFFSPTPIANVPAKSSGVDFLLVNRTGAIKGWVRDRDTAEPLANAKVEATNPSGARRQAFSNSDGQFVITGLVPTGFYNVTAVKSGFFTETQSNVAPGDTTLVLGMLRRYGFVRGRILDLAAGRPMADVPVVATPVGAEGRKTTATTNLDGEYLLRLIADFYIVQPALSHYRNEPREQQVEVAEVDTVLGIDFALEAQTVQAITISRADQSPDPEIANTDTVRFTANAVDPNNRPVNIGHPIWKLDVSPRAAVIDTSGRLQINPTFFGDVTVTAADPVSRRSGSLLVRIFAAIDSTTNTIFFNDRGLQLMVGRSAVTSPQRLLVAKEAMAPAKRGRAELFSVDSSYVIKAADFNRPVKLILPSPPNSNDLERFIGRWDVVANKWTPVLPSFINPNNRVEANITTAGEYTALARAGALAIANLTLQPNPFSPFQEIDGRPGLKIQFDLSSNVAPNPLLSVKIYNLEGNLVRLLHDQTPFPRGPATIYWDGRADDGVLARNGRYLVRFILEDPSDSKDVMKSVVLIK